MLLNDTNKNDYKNHFETFLEFASIGIVITDNRGKITSINPFALKEFGYTKTELIGKQIGILIPSRFRKNHQHYIKGYVEKPQSRKMGEGLCQVATKKDGTEFLVEVSLSDFHIEGAQFIIAFINDITSRKQNEEKIARLNNELELAVQNRTKDLQQALLQLEYSNIQHEKAIAYQKAILDNAGAMIIATDKEGIIRLFNPEAALNLGYRESEVINKMTPMVFHEKSEIERKRDELVRDFGVYIKSDFEVMVEKSRRNIHEEQQYNYVRKDGSVFPVALTITAIHDRDGEIIGFMGISFDVTAQKKIQDDLIRSLEKEKELNELKSRFVSMASHEFRTPLSTVLSSAFLIEKYTKTSEQPQREKHLQRIESSVSMLTDILNDFLSIGKMEEGKIQIRFLHFNIEKLAMDIISELKNTLKKHQKIKYTHQGGQEVYLDPSLLKHIIQNLVSNASKFSPEKSLIEIKTSLQNQHLVLTVRDNGIGISKEDQKHLMERFFRGANAGNIQGTGLGLHIVSKYAELMNGNVKCISELEQGTTMQVTFKIKQS